MSEINETGPDSWFLKDESDDKDPDEIRQLSESELQRELRRAGDRLRFLQVKQGDSDWYPAKIVLKKFIQLAREGIYVRREGAVEGPFTASKTIEVLEEKDLDDVQAKVGIHSDWVSATRLLQRLKNIKEGMDQDESEETDEENVFDAHLIEADDDDDLEDDDDIHIELLDDDEIIDVELIDEEPVEAEAIDDKPLIELVMVAEPVALPQRQQAQPQHTPAVSRPSRPDRQTTSKPRRPASSSRQQATSSNSGLLIVISVIGVLALLIVVGGVAAFALTRGSSGAVTEVGDPNPTDSEVDAPVEVRARADGPPPVVRTGTIYRPSFTTSMGQASGGTLFSARVGRSNRMVLIGAAHLLGPATGLSRQLRGAEVVMHLQRVEITDSVDGETKTAPGKALRLRTAEYPSISVHGDAFVFEPSSQIGLDPLGVASTTPNKGDRVWLVAPVRGSETLAHPGRWVGAEGDWLLYRLDDPSLDLLGTSGGAVVNVDHKVVGIHVASRQSSSSGKTMIASPIKAIVAELR